MPYVRTLGARANAAGAMVLVGHDAFLGALQKMYDAATGAGTVYVSQKRCESPPSSAAP